MTAAVQTGVAGFLARFEAQRDRLPGDPALTDSRCRCLPPRGASWCIVGSTRGGMEIHQPASRGRRIIPAACDALCWR